MLYNNRLNMDLIWNPANVSVEFFTSKNDFQNDE